MKECNDNEIPSLDFEDLQVITPVGRGAKGVVFLTKTGQTGEQSCLALKVISKALLEKKKKEGCAEYKRLSFEQQVLRRFDHPLLPRLRGVIETQNIVGFAIDYCDGGTFHSLRSKQSEKMFSHDTIRFYAVELLLALEYLHNLGIVYRDLKPENIMIQQNGHIMLVDFDLSTKLNTKSISDESLSQYSYYNSSKLKKKRCNCLLSRFKYGISPCDGDSELVEKQVSICKNTIIPQIEKSNSFVGTEEYVAPEVVAGKGHDFSVDWWSYGVVLYEMLYGTTPFTGLNRNQTFHSILTKEPELTGTKTALRDLIRRLLEKDPGRRIKVHEIKGHDFFKGVKWDIVLEIARPPYIPHNEVRDIVGFSKKDVELFVHGIYFPNSGDEDKNNHKVSHSETKNEDFGIF
ncbi:hypothetical protein TanjilG_14728 [Lupinus angustifolius]|uniref:serine/threonine-protein kinase OXI1-like n=1 Tax=Lupinus angustifolius TaxID=3871 RepID=UPI00090DBA0F|nr:PREDICTED: serine/threonine-protein kinase OXI1-like [Lupinus angustifolius]OIV90330.1 hypothetical protein TanjilG_14728 [Lupinus angustifolius]